MQLNSFCHHSTFFIASVRKIPDSSHLYNFYVHVPDWGSLGTRPVIKLISKLKENYIVCETTCMKNHLSQLHTL